MKAINLIRRTYYIFFGLMMFLCVLSCSDNSFRGNTAQSKDTEIESGNIIKVEDEEKKITVDEDNVNLSICEQGTQKVKTFNVYFAPTNGCAWGVAPNLSKGSGTDHVRAIKEEQKIIELSSLNAQAICAFDLNVNEESVVVDDSVAVSLDDYLLFDTTFTNDLYVNAVGMSTKNGIIKYEPAKIIGINKRPYNHKPHCATSVKCSSTIIQMGDNQQKGSLDLKLEADFFDKVGIDLRNSTDKDMKLGLTTTGNKNSTDCGHTAMTFKVTVKYVKK